MIRDASGHLLYTDLSRWADVRVVDDQRADDLTRSTAGDSPRAGSLDQDLAIGRRAGARNLVVGDFLISEGIAQVTARVYDARSGRRVRTAQARIAPFTDLDSLISGFSRIARDVLGVPPPPGATLGVIGTRSLVAYRAYLTGVAALNRFAIDTAARYLEQAIAADSTFGLAFYKLSLTQNWIPPRPGDTRHVIETAARFAGPLPTRERALIAGLLAMRNLDYPRACDAYRGLVAVDSNDVEALYGLGDCNFHDQVPVRLASDTSRATLRGSRTEVWRSMARAIEVDPAFQPPYEHLMHVLLRDRFVADCAPSGCTQRGTATVLVRWDHDTLVSDVRTAVQRPWGVLDTLTERFATRRIGLPRASIVAGRWAAVAPESEYAHLLRSETLAALNELPESEHELDLAARVKLGRINGVSLAIRRVTLSLRQLKTADAAAIVDSVYASPDTIGTTALRTEARIMGRYRMGNRNGTARDSAYTSWVALAAGVVGADTVRQTAERVVRVMAESTLPSQKVAYQDGIMRGIALVAARYGSVFVGVLDAPSLDPIRVCYAGLDRGDTASARRALARFDAIQRRLDADAPDNGGWLLSSEAHLALGDSAGALRQMREWADRLPRFVPRDGAIVGIGAYAGSFMWGRALLLYGDLLAASGDRAAARPQYQALIGLWAGGDPEVQPFVTRARAALARMR